MGPPSRHILFPLSRWVPPPGTSLIVRAVFQCPPVLKPFSPASEGQYAVLTSAFEFTDINRAI
eukprot:1176744-Prorocentrum_minimum.AAC.7